MIYFITKEVEFYRNKFDPRVFKDIIVLEEEQGINLFFQIQGKKRMLSVDLEATGLDAYLSKPLLYGIGTKKDQFMLDWTVNPTPIFEHMIKYNVNALGHNIQYDIRMIKVHTGLLLKRVYDTMVADQRIWMKVGYRWGYADLIERYLKKVIIKSVRNEFIGVDTNKFKINASHLYYLKGDLTDLWDIRKHQKYYIKKFKQQFLIFGIEFPLISVIAEAELEGFTLNVTKWLERLTKEKQTKFETEIALDEELRRLRDFKSTWGMFNKIDPRTTLSGGKYDRQRVHNTEYDIFNSDGTTNLVNLFGEKMSHQDVTRTKKKIILNPNNIAWNSKKEIIQLFAALEEPLPTKLGTYQIPQLDSHGKLVGTIHNYTIEEDALLKYMLQKEDSIMKDLITLKIKHSKLEKSINTYGENFINKINKVTGNIHTSFRQCFAETGRFQSGGGKKESDKYNAQNIPRDISYRECFTVDTKRYSLSTADYSGAELIVMASHAQDFRLIELSNQDMHSYMATKTWRNIFGYRASNLLKAFTKNIKLKTNALINEYNKNVELYKTYTISSKENKEKRTEFKPMTFGVIYGLYAKKAGTTLNITKEEGQVAINTISSEIPKTIAMVKQASLDAEMQGYVILNDRTNSRAWFPTLIRLIKKEISKDTHFMEISNETSAARNIRIQGTQADFVKEASVVLDRYFKKHKIDALIISWIHDELVVRVPKYLDGVSDEWCIFIDRFPDFLLPPSIKGKRFNNTEELIRDIMIEVANRYLKNVTIDVEISTHDTWVK